MATSTYHHGNLREALVDAAVEAARERGAAALALRELARRVGVSHNAAYRHFANRDELLSEVAARVMEQMVATMTRRWDQVTTDDPVLRARLRLAEVGRAYVEFALTEPGLFSLVFTHLASVVDLSGSSPYQLLGQALDEQVEVGFLSPEARVGAEITCWSAVHGFAVLALDGVASGPTEAEREGALATVLHAIDRSYAASTGTPWTPLDLAPRDLPRIGRSSPVRVEREG
jgi:AcrR family transcriptional regulator